MTAGVPDPAGELREALAVLLAHERAGKLSAWGLADALIAGPLATFALTPAEQAAFEAVDPPEVVVERVARALYAEGAWCGCCDFDGWGTCSACCRIVRGYAIAAIAALGTS